MTIQMYDFLSEDINKTERAKMEAHSNTGTIYGLYHIYLYEYFLIKKMILYFLKPSVC